jgi:hypothetical protein
MSQRLRAYLPFGLFVAVTCAGAWLAGAAAQDRRSHSSRPARTRRILMKN